MDEAQDTCNYYQAMEELQNYSKESMEAEYNVQMWVYRRGYKKSIGFKAWMVQKMRLENCKLLAPTYPVIQK